MTPAWLAVSAVLALTFVALPGATLAAPNIKAEAFQQNDPSPHSDITIGAELKSVRPGERFTVALRVTLDPGWHTYWTNGGDAGLPLNATWRLPDGSRVGTVQFPTPSLMPEKPLMTYGYTDEVVYLAEVTLPAGVAAGQTVTLEASTDWLACAELCLPAAGEVSLPLQVTAGESERDPQWAPVVEQARLRMPRDAMDWTVRGWTNDDGYVLAIMVPPAAGAPMLSPYFFVDSLNIVEHADVQRVARVGDTLFMQLARSAFADADQSYMSGVLASDVTLATSTSFHMATAIGTVAEAGALATRGAALLGAGDAMLTGGVDNVIAQTAVLAAPTGSDLGFAAAALFAFLGGLILNLMPCVFPVLSVKVLGFVEHGGGDAGAGRRHGLVFASGVLATFWVLAGTLLAVRAGGESLGWGFQMQSPPVVALLALVIFALGLNLSGVFEIGMSLTRLGGAGAGRSYTDSFLTGALAVIVATPCTAPFMGAALGYALVQPPVASMLVFTALALGLALPYVVLAAVPSLLRFLPRPGPWLETFKQALAFPLYATVVWLLWVFGQQKDMNALAVLMLGLTLFSLGAWAWGRAAMRQRMGGRVFGGLAMAGAVAMAVLGNVSRGTASEETAGAIAWEAYSPARVAELRAEGRPVLIDFTAAWCLSCQVNERVALRSASAQRAFSEANVALVQADWTSRDPEIAAVLASYGRSGIPLYVLYGTEPNGEPELLPAVLTPGIVVDAVARAVAGRGATTGAD